MALLCAAVAVGGHGVGHAQSADTSPKTTIPKDATEIPTLTVEAKRKRSAILPTTTNALGLNQTLLETPRSVSTVSLAMIDQYSLKTVRDLIAVTPGVFTATFYGVDGTVDIRGEYADNYFRGFKRVENQGTYQTPIESALDLDIVRGVASPVYGAGRAGGYVDFTPHSDRAERFMNGQSALGEVDGSVGTYGSYNVTAEYGSPFKIGGQDAGFDFWFEHNRTPEYFYNIAPEHTMFQVGLSSGLGDQWSFNAGFQYFYSTGLAGTTGLNRLTQNLINNDVYTSGSFLQQIVTPGAPYITPAMINAIGGVTEYYGVVTPYSELNPATIKQVRLNYRTIITSPLDFGNVTTPTGYLDISRPIGNGKLLLQGFADSMNADSYNGYGFAKSLRDRAYEGRISYTGTFSPTSWYSVNYVAGVGYRYYQADEKYAYALGYLILDRQDISVGATPDSIIDPVYLTNGPWDQVFHSRLGDAGEFISADMAFFKKLHLQTGFRYDEYSVQASNTGLIDYSVNLDTVYKATEARPSYSFSLSYDLPFGLVPYITYGKSYALETSQGGAVAPGDVAGHTFLSPSTLTEGGIKGSFFDGHLYFALADYHQEREQTQLLSSNFVGADSRGQEAEIRWAIDRHFAISGVATHEITYVHGCSYLYSTPSQVGIPNEDGWGYVYSVASCAYPGLENGYRDHTQPEWVFGLFGNYEVGNGLGFTFGGNYVSKTGGELPGAIVFPDYYLFRGSAHYDWGRYRLSVFINNIFDTRYYIPQRSTETEGTAMPGEGRTASIKLTAHF